VRNMYESDLGRFDRAIPLDTETFSESWDALDRVLQGLLLHISVYIQSMFSVKVSLY
jgi:predicted sulfurtransferase